MPIQQLGDRKFAALNSDLSQVFALQNFHNDVNVDTVDLLGTSLLNNNTWQKQ